MEGEWKNNNPWAKEQKNNNTALINPHVKMEGKKERE